MTSQQDAELTFASVMYSNTENFHLGTYMKYLNEANWNWRLMKTIMTTCHVYNKERFYFPFDKIAPKEAQPITFLRKFMPDYA